MIGLEEEIGVRNLKNLVFELGKRGNKKFNGSLTYQFWHHPLYLYPFGINTGNSNYKIAES